MSGQEDIDLGGPDRPEIVGFGALNVDYIASASRLSERLAEQVTESTARFEWNSEGPVDESVITTAIERLGAASLDASLGGSAWITTYALAQMRIGVPLGYVGVAGRIETPGLSFLRQMDLLGIDRRWVARRPDKLSGICLSYLEDAERVMLTHPGANFAMADHLRAHGPQIARYLAGARIVHVTSFLDTRTPAYMLKILTEARRLEPALLVSLDPGYDWATHRSDAVNGLLALADLLFVNYREFKALGDYAPGESDEAVAARVLGRCAQGSIVFVTKRYDFVEVFRAAGAGVHTQRFQLERPSRETTVEDATGAGDVFSAAVLASLTSRRLIVELGAFLGLSLARQKLSHGSGYGPPVFQSLRQGFLQSTETLSGPGVRPAGVLVAHDGNPHWESLRRFVEADCDLPVQILGTDELDRGDLEALVRNQLSRCSFAICVLSASRPMSSGGLRPDQNIVHQAGMFQGRYGFGRVAILAEEGSEPFSNIAGLVRLDFPPGRIESTFLALERMLLREGLLTQGGGRDVR
jgi:sugar/nucleoside kinase (ribokinase family)